MSFKRGNTLLLIANSVFVPDSLKFQSERTQYSVEQNNFCMYV